MRSPVRFLLSFLNHLPSLFVTCELASGHVKLPETKCQAQTLNKSAAGLGCTPDMTTSGGFRGTSTGQSSRV